MLLLWYHIYLTYVPEKQAHNLLKNIVFEFFCSSSVYFYGVAEVVDLLIVELIKLWVL